jgi:hypothetical protein
MNKVTIATVVFGALVTLTGCREDGPTEVVQTVDWFKAHKAERTEVLAKCKANPGELSNTPNCINARRAASSITWSARGGINVKPLTAADINKQ